MTSIVRFGLIGTGRIGQAFIKKCAGFDTNILCFDPAYENHDYIKAIQEVLDLRFQRGISRERCSIRYTTLNEALSSADFISLHAPLLREGESPTPTYHLINETTLRMTKPTAMLVNTSRGPVVDEIALARALRENWIAGAALDVFEDEPLPAGHTLWTMPNVLITPHIAGYGPLLNERRFEIIVDNCRAMLEGSPLRNVVDKASWF